MITSAVHIVAKNSREQRHIRNYLACTLFGKQVQALSEIVLFPDMLPDPVKMALQSSHLLEMTRGQRSQWVCISVQELTVLQCRDYLWLLPFPQNSIVLDLFVGPCSVWHKHNRLACGWWWRSRLRGEKSQRRQRRVSLMAQSAQSALGETAGGAESCCWETHAFVTLSLLFLSCWRPIRQGGVKRMRWDEKEEKHSGGLRLLVTRVGERQCEEKAEILRFGSEIDGT